MTMTENATETEDRVIGTVTPKQLLRAKELQAARFVHVTGLPNSNYEPNGDGHVTIQAHRAHLGHHDYNNGKTVVITEDGEIWLRAGSGSVDSRWCPNGVGAYVPCSNGEEVPTHLLLERVLDPYSDCDGLYPFVPFIRD